MKIKLPSEIAYLLAILILSFAVAMLTAADFGISMIVAPAYLLSLKTGFLSFGQAEYVIQAGIFVLLCLLLRRFRVVYLTSFLTCLIYGAVLDLWRRIPFFNPQVTAPGSMPTGARIPMFIVGMLLTSVSVALFYKVYLYPQVYDFFVKGVSEKYRLNRSVFKTVFDLICLAAATAMAFAFFGEWKGIGWGTLIMAVFNGTLIGLFCRFFDAHFEILPLFPKFAARFDLEETSEKIHTAT